MIEARGLTKTFDGLLAVDDVELTVAAGEIVGLVGVNGAGKTTLLRMLCGILQPTAGNIAIAGHPLQRDSIAARAALAFVPDTPMLFEQLTVQEHLLFIARLYGVKDAGPAMDALLARFELSDKRRDTASSLSRGMRQKLAICCAFLHEPAALLLDEPLSGLDPPGRRSMCDAVAARAAAGSAVLVSSHELEIIEKLCHRFVILHRGRVRLAGTLAQVRGDLGTLEEVFLRATGTSDDRPAATGPT
ncbi:MAG TPA: ABC transporter ATP-binding protein [Planctomycetota bacterium]|nr:ABC transporter ATP-binding protein [Planctomycetota bacterium]